MQWKLCMWVGWKVCRLTMMQWSNLIKCGLFLNIVSPAGHTLLPLVLQCLDCCGIEALIVILKKVLNCSLHIYDIIIGPILLPRQVFFHFGKQKIVRWCQIRKIWRVITSSKPQSCTAAIATTDLCAGALSWWNRTPFVSFPGCFEMSLVLLFKVLNYLSSVGLYLEGNNPVSIRKG